MERLTSQRVPKIDSSKINDVFQEISPMFRSVTRSSPLWICGRESSFGFRPSLEKFIPGIMTNLIPNLESGKIVLTPLIFYTCGADDPEKVLSSKVRTYERRTYERRTDERRSDFLVSNHYNLLITYINSSGVITLERYEPANATRQSSLNEKLTILFTKLFRKYSKRTVKFELIAPKGLQSLNRDADLCGHHIVYFAVYRLKYGKNESVRMLTSEDSKIRFQTFCRLISSDLKKAVTYV